jgi:hypothetical protein
MSDGNWHHAMAAISPNGNCRDADIRWTMLVEHLNAMADPKLSFGGPAMADNAGSTMRPPGISRFAILYPVALAIDQVGNFLYLTGSGLWQQAGAIAPLSMLLVIGTLMLLWYLTVWRRSSVAKWIIVGLLGLSLVSLGLSLINRSLVLEFSHLLGVVALIVRAVAVRNLFYGGSAEWFGRSDRKLSDIEDQGPDLADQTQELRSRN